MAPLLTQETFTYKQQHAWILSKSLETLGGELDFGVHFENINTVFAAHSKVDGHTGDWIQFGLENGLKAIPTSNLKK